MGWPGFRRIFDLVQHIFIRSFMLDHPVCVLEQTVARIEKIIVGFPIVDLGIQVLAENGAQLLLDLIANDAAIGDDGSGQGAAAIT